MYSEPRPITTRAPTSLSLAMVSRFGGGWTIGLSRTAGSSKGSAAALPEANPMNRVICAEISGRIMKLMKRWVPAGWA